MYEPFALEIYRRFKRGESVEQLAAEFQIPRERIEMRIDAAIEYLERKQNRAA
jgi:hypothetical protein